MSACIDDRQVKASARKLAVIVGMVILGVGLIAGVSVDCPPPYQPVFHASVSGKPHDLARILDNDPMQLNARLSGRPAIHYAIIAQRRQNVEVFLKSGADIEGRDDVGNTALMIAVISGQTQIVKLLIAKGAKVDIVNDYGQTPLMMAGQLDDGKEITAALKNRIKS